MKSSRAALIVLVVVAGAWAYTELRPPKPDTRPAGTAADFTIATGAGPVRLADLRGKVVLIDFWATWCGPCRDSIPGVERLYQSRRDRGFEVLGVSLDDSDAAIPPFVREMGMTYPVGRPTSPEVLNDYGAGSIPMMVLVDKQGQIRWRQTGYSPATDRALGEVVDSLLQE